MIKNLKATNKNGASFKFDRRFRMTKGLDLSGVQADVNSAEGASPGSSYQNTRIRDRYFDVEFQIRKNEGVTEFLLDDIRARIYNVFNPELNPIRLDFDLSDGQSYYLSAHLEGTPVMPPDKSNNNSAYQRVLLQFKATDPFIYAANMTTVDIASWVPTFEFPLEIPDGIGIEMGYKSQSLIKNVFNDGGIITGTIIEFKAVATVTNPSLININTYEKLQLNVVLQAGDVLRVNTNRGSKSAILVRDNVEHDYFHAIDILSDFLQLAPGDNLFRYDADDGLDHLEVRMTFSTKYLGV